MKKILGVKICSGCVPSLPKVAESDEKKTPVHAFFSSKDAAVPSVEKEWTDPIRWKWTSKLSFALTYCLQVQLLS